MTTPGVPRRLLRHALRPRTRPVDLLIAALLLVLGFGVAVQVRSTQQDGVLASTRPDDLAQILDELGNRGVRLRQEISTLTATQQRLSSGTGADAAALADAQSRARLLGVLAGTLPATGPGIRLTVQDPAGKVSAAALLEALEELRDAGAEAVQLSGTGADGSTSSVRVVASTSLEDAEVGITVGDGTGSSTVLTAPYSFEVIGDAGTLAGAMTIPGGVVDTVKGQGGSATVAQLRTVLVSALHPLTPLADATPAVAGGS